MSVALLSQAKKYAQPSSRVVGIYVLNKFGATTTARNLSLDQSDDQKIGYRMQDRQKNWRKVTHTVAVHAWKWG